MTKPETEWVIVPREPTDGMQVYFWRCYNEQQPGTALSIKFRRAFMEMLAASPPAPSVVSGGLVLEWRYLTGASASYPNAATNLAALVEMGDRMAAALTAQATRIAELEVIARAYADLEDVQKVRTLEATVTAQAKTIEGLEREDERLHDVLANLEEGTEQYRALAQAAEATVTELRSTAGRLQRNIDELAEDFEAMRSRATTAEASLETARGALAECEAQLATLRGTAIP